MAPTLDRMIERPELERQLIKALTGTGATEVGLTTGLQGAGGFGKTRLATWVCHQQEIRQRYPGGLLWVTIGQDVRGADLALRINDLSFVLSGQRPAISSPDAAGAELGQLLDEQDPVLLVIDDVWDEPQLRPFRSGGHSCSRLVTSRNPDLLPASSTRLRVDAMSTDQAERLISHGVTGLPMESVRELTRLAGRWPVLLNLINGALRRRIERGQRPDSAAEETVRQLVEHGPVAFDPARPADRSQAAAATVGASLSLLDLINQQRYLDLAIVPEDVDIPLHVLTLLWPGHRADRLCEELVSLGLAADYRLDPPEPRLVIHDVIRSYLRTRRDANERAEVHRRLVGAAASLLPVPGNATSWWLLPDHADYFWRYLPYHLKETGMADQLLGLVGDLRWVEAKTRKLGSAVPVEADLALLNTPFTETLRHQLELAGPLLGTIDPPAALGATLASRLTGVPGLETALSQYRATLPRPRLEPDWPLPDRPDPTRSAQPGHTGWVTNCAFSPDGTLLATVSDDGTARIWRIADGTEIAVLTGHAGGLWGCEFSPDGSLLATSSTDRTVRLWEMSTGEQIAVLRGHDDWARACAFSPDGKLLASASADHTVRVWNLEDNTEKAILTGHTGGVWSCAFSPDGSLLATASYGQVMLWNITEDTYRTILTGHDEVDSCAFSPDGSLLATTSYGRVLLWNVGDGTKQATFTGHTGAVWGCAFSPDGTLLATVSNDQTARLWRVTDATEHAIFAGRNSKTNSCSFSPDGTLIATTSYDSSVRLWQVEHGTELKALKGHSNRVISCNFSPDGSLLATTSYAEVRLWRIHNRDDVLVLAGHTDWVRSCAFSPDGALLATGSADRTTRLWQVSDGTQRTVLTSHTSGVRSCAFSPDGDLIATGSADGTVKLWVVATGAEHIVLSGHTSGVHSCAFSPDGVLLATASGDRTVRLWRVSNGTEHTVLTGHTSWADRCSFSPDGSLLATVSNDQTVRLWNAKTGTGHCALRVGGPLAWVAWHPSGTRLCTVGGAGVYLFNYLP